MKQKKTVSNKSNFEKWVDIFNIQPAGIIHVGAHLVPERSIYKNKKFEPVLWIESQEEMVRKAEILLRDCPNQKIVNSTLWSTVGETKTFFNASNNGGSSSLLDLNLHKASYPEIVITDTVKVITNTLEELARTQINQMQEYKILILDTQGSELEILKGGKSILSNFDVIICEVSIRKLYKNGPLIKDIENFLNDSNYIMTAFEINRTVGWGDALFLKQKGNEYDLQIVKEKENFIYSGPMFTLGTFLRTMVSKMGMSSTWITRNSILSSIKELTKR